MYAHAQLARDRHRESLARAHERGQASRVRALQKASRRMARAERRLFAARTGVMKARADLVDG
jgi:hypothetical protein